MTRTGVVSLAVAAAVAGLLLAVWRIWQPDEVAIAYERTVRDAEVDWRCEAGHLFTSHGQPEPRPCWKCGKTAYIVTTHRCTLHGAFEVAYRFHGAADGAIEPQWVRVGSGEWTPWKDGVRCSKCGRVCAREIKDALAGVAKPRPRRDGR
jgi:ribosomal protein L37E